MKKFRLLLLFALASILFFNACEKEDQLVNESYVQNYKDNDIKSHKVKICVQKGNGEWHGIEVAKASEAAHIKKGAIYPGNCFAPHQMVDLECIVRPIFETKMDGLDDDCDGLIDCDDLEDMKDHDSCKQGLSVSSKGIFGRGAWYSNFCDIYVEDGLTDWRIPTYEEIKQLEEEERLYEIKFRPYRYWIRNLDYYTFTLKDYNFYLRTSDYGWYKYADPQLQYRGRACFCVQD